MLLLFTQFRERGPVGRVAEMSITHRDVHDPDVAAVLRLVQREAEIDRLRRQGRL
jgi:hypothetical protein